MNYRQTFFNLKGELKQKNENIRQLQKVHNKVNSKFKSGDFECLSILSKEKELDLAKKIAKKLRKFEYILFLGTGGSSLGGKTLHYYNNNQFFNSNKPKIFFIENVDSDPIFSLLKSISLKKTALVVISKSGETIETLCQFFFIKEFMKNELKDLSKNILIITESKDSTLMRLQKELKCKFLEHNNKIGGRFSIFSIVGMLPAELSGLNSKKITKGGLDIIKLMKKNKKATDFPPALGALHNFNLISNGIKQNVLMPYSDCLTNFSLWFRQLWGESIGKKGLGSTPINASGTVDQHSQLQLYLDGPKDKFLTIIYFTKKEKIKKLDCTISSNHKYMNLENRSMDDLFYAEAMATKDSLKKRNIPLRIFELKLKNEETIGSILMHFFLETIYTCYLLKIDPFNQPAVEEGKEIAVKYLRDVKNKTSS